LPGHSCRRRPDEQQLRTIADLKPVGYVVDRATADGIDISSLKKALVGAEALPASLRAELRGRRLSVLQCYGTADLGIIAYESMSPDAEVCPGVVLDEGIIVDRGSAWLGRYRRFGKRLRVPCSNVRDNDRLRRSSAHLQSPRARIEFSDTSQAGEG
jgi:hypothetical protein